jgi:hypothetical protein
MVSSSATRDTSSSTRASSGLSSTTTGQRERTSRVSSRSRLAEAGTAAGVYPPPPCFRALRPSGKVVEGLDVGPRIVE